jgi:hypothetical protein
MIEWLGMLGLGIGIKAAADGVDGAAKRSVRRATKAVKKAGKAALEHLDERGPYNPLERDPSAGLHAHQDEVILDDGVRVHVRCTKCGRVQKGSA